MLALSAIRDILLLAIAPILRVQLVFRSVKVDNCMANGRTLIIGLIVGNLSLSFH